VAGGAFAVYIGMLVVNGQVSFGWVLLAAVCAAVSGLVTLLANLIFHVVAIAARAKKAGLLHPFSLMLDGDGLHIQSARGESLLKWSGVAFVRRNRDYIFVGITPYTFFLIPMRMFQSPHESEAFWVRMCDLWRAFAQGA
jgi:hypothetical protein